MQKNIGKIDMLVRNLLAITLALLIFLNVLNGTPGLIAGAVAVILSVTAVLGRCPLYCLIGVSSCRVRPKSDGSTPDNTPPTA